MSKQRLSLERAARVSAFAILLGLSLSSKAAPTLDTSFGTNGIVEHPVVGNSGVAAGTVALRDGTLFATGYSTHPYKGGIRAFGPGVAERYNGNGSINPTPIPPIGAMLVQRDGKWVGVTQTGLTRFHSDGSPELAYILDGAAGIPWFANMGVGGVAEQVDGKIVVAGNAYQVVVLLRFNRNGSLDTSFNDVGALIVPHGNADVDYSESGLVIQPDGKLVVATSNFVGVSSKLEFTAIRVNPNGTMDATFGVNGKSIIAFDDTFQDYARTILLQPNGRLIVAGSRGDTIQMVGFRADNGALDETFGTAGVVRITAIDNESTSNPHDVIVQPDGKLLMSATTDMPGSNGRLMRLSVDGSPDSSFGTAGTFTSAQLPVIVAIALQPDGDLFLGGTSPGSNFAVGRFTSGPSAAIEYYNAPLNHYFLSMSPQEVADLDLGVYSGWARTGLSFLTYGSAASAVGSSANPVCRFYIPPQHGDSHFFSADPVECAIARDKIHTDPNFSGYVEETPNAFYIDLPDKDTGACPANTAPVYRLWNQGVASNHRYTTSVVVKNQMIASGWVAEGYGPDQVDMCAPQ
jgi:uncharacterized delta-60 repeat protein